MQRNRPNCSRGFTLMEMLITISIIVTLLSIVTVSIDPARRIHQARNAVRWSNVNTILSSVKKYQVDNEGELPAAVDKLPFDEYIMIGTGTDNAACRGTKTEPYKNSRTLCQTEFGAGETNQDCLDLTGLRPYLADVPIDPKTGTPEFSRFYFSKESNGLLKVGACDPEGEEFGGSGKVRFIEITN